MKGINKAIIVGTCGKDPETRYTPSGTAITNISVATSESWTDKQSGQKQEKTEWHNVTFFGKVAEIAGEYLKKGSQVYVEGSITTEKWQDKEGNDRYTTKIKGRDMQMLGGRSSEGAPASNTAPAHVNDSYKPANGPIDDSFDDDIPF